MTDDPFRDDHEAALQRADALARENEELRRENERLKAAKQPKPKKPAPEASGPSSSASWGSMTAPARKRWLLMRSPVALAVIALFVVPPCVSHHRKAAYDDAVAARDAEVARWHFANDLRDCIRTEQFSELDDSFSALDAAVTDPRVPNNQSYRVAQLSSLVGGCVDHAQARQVMEGKASRVDVPLAADAQAARRAWQAADGELSTIVERLRTYYGGGDWRDDGYRGAPELWATLAAARKQRQAALVHAREVLFPITREMQVAVQKRFAAANDTAHWWQLEVELRLEDVADAYLVAASTGKLVADQRAAMVAAAKALVAELDNAPIDVKRRVRGDATTMGLAEPDNDRWDPGAQASALRGTHFGSLSETDVAGPEPAEPAGCGGDGD